MGTKTASTYLPYKVKDMSLAEYGRREIHLAEALLTEIVDKQQKDSMAHYYYQHILQQHNISKDDFDQSMNAYFSNPQALDSMYQKIIQAISDEKKQLDAPPKEALQESKKR